MCRERRTLLAACVAKGLDHVQHRTALAGAEIPGADAGVVLAQVVERHQVALREIQDVQVVADGRPVVGGIVCPCASIVIPAKTS